MFDQISDSVGGFYDGFGVVLRLSVMISIPAFSTPFKLYYLLHHFLDCRLGGHGFVFLLRQVLKIGTTKSTEPRLIVIVIVIKNQCRSSRGKP